MSTPVTGDLILTPRHQRSRPDHVLARPETLEVQHIDGPGYLAADLVCHPDPWNGRG